jgi:hypothetical protein
VDFVTTHAVQTGVPLQLSTLPNVLALLPANTTRTCVVAAVAAGNVTITSYADVECTEQMGVATFAVGACTGAAFRWTVVLD